MNSIADLLVIPRVLARSPILPSTFKDSTVKSLNPLTTSGVIPFNVLHMFLTDANTPIIFFALESYPISLYNSYKIYFTTNKIYAIIYKN